ncbi:MAG: endolytic transglycosylase MltG [Candidatus Gracilibacteria bacterium]
MKQILIFYILIISFLFINTSFANNYTLITNDYKIIENIEIKLDNIILRNKKFNYDNVILILEKYNQKPKSDRLYMIFNRLIYNLKIKQNKIIILEGWNIFDIDNYLYYRNLINKGEYILYVENVEKINSLSKYFPFLDNQETIEGYLYPDTYEINSSNFHINEFVIKQLEAFENKVYNKLFLDEDKNPIYINRVIESIINLSSIVEKEEKNINEKATVAGILKKRVKEYWNIGADITTCYPYRLTGTECKLVISKYININSEYNTRFIIGLPPTPIGNPSFDTIEATVNHEETNYYYYLHDTVTGKIYYAETNEEHNKFKSLYIN